MTIKHGLNQDKGTYDDDRYIRCSNCGFICHLDRDLRAPFGSKTGQGRSMASTTLSSAVTAGDTSVSLTGISGFPTPSTGSISAFADMRMGTKVTSASHGITGGAIIISGTTNYDGTYRISEVTDNNFVIGAKYVADDATGTWKKLEYFTIHDVGSYATDGDVSSTYTASTSGPRVTRVSYTGVSGTDLTGCVGTNAHDSGATVNSGLTAASGCPMCGSYTFDKEI